MDRTQPCGGWNRGSIPREDIGIEGSITSKYIVLKFPRSFALRGLREDIGIEIMHRP